jgi:hypothetical protein
VRVNGQNIAVFASILAWSQTAKAILHFTYTTSNSPIAPFSNYAHGSSFQGAADRTSTVTLRPTDTFDICQLESSPIRFDHSVPPVIDIILNNIMNIGILSEGILLIKYFTGDHH